MNIFLQSDRVELRPNQMLRVDRPAGMRIVCIRGSLWVTQHDDLRDFFVQTGESLVLDGGGAALVSASEASSVWLEAPVGPPGLLDRVIPIVLRRLVHGLRAGRRRAAIELQGY